MHSNTKAALRKKMRNKRQQLTLAQQNLASQLLFFKISKHPAFTHAKKIGFYFANDGEISVEPLFRYALKQNKSCFFPKIESDNTMSFRAFKADKNLRKNTYGILEPSSKATKIKASQLDLVFAPLVAWSSDGKRLGMGGGFYDKYFQFRKKPGQRKPLLIGTAHYCQRAEGIESETWDIVMDMIASDHSIVKKKCN